MLVVEDGGSIQNDLSAPLAAINIYPVFAKNWQAGSSHLLSNRLPNVILLDRRNPSSGGDLFVLELKRNPIYQKIPIIYINTADVEFSDLSSSVDPNFDIQGLLNAIRKAVFGK